MVDLQVLEEQYDRLSSDIQAILYSNDTNQAIQEIGRKHQLHINKIDTLQHAVADVLLGEVDAAGFVNHLKRELHIDETLAGAVATDIDQQIFERVRSSLNRPRSEEDVDPEGAVTEAPSQRTQTPELPPIPKKRVLDEEPVVEGPQHLIRPDSAEPIPTLEKPEDFQAEYFDAPTPESTLTVPKKEKTRPQEDVDGPIALPKREVATVVTDPYREPIE